MKRLIYISLAVLLLAACESKNSKCLTNTFGGNLWVNDSTNQYFLDSLQFSEESVNVVSMGSPVNSGYTFDEGCGAFQLEGGTRLSIIENTGNVIILEMPNEPEPIWFYFRRQ
jgi:hypothetical protein